MDRNKTITWSGSVGEPSIKDEAQKTAIRNLICFFHQYCGIDNLQDMVNEFSLTDFNEFKKSIAQVSNLHFSNVINSVLNEKLGHRMIFEISLGTIGPLDITLDLKDYTENMIKNNGSPYSLQGYEKIAMNKLVSVLFGEQHIWIGQKDDVYHGAVYEITNCKKGQQHIRKTNRLNLNIKKVYPENEQNKN